MYIYLGYTSCCTCYLKVHVLNLMHVTRTAVQLYLYLKVLNLVQQYSCTCYLKVHATKFSTVCIYYKYNLHFLPTFTTYIYYRHLSAQNMLPGNLVRESQYL